MTAQEYIQSGAIENYILGMANDAEARELEQMRALYPEVNDAIMRFEAELEAHCLDAAIAPPDESKKRIIAAIGIGQISTEPVAKVVELPAKRKSQWMQYAAAACIAIMMGSVFMNFMLMGRIKRMGSEIGELRIAANKIDSQNSFEAQYAFMRDPAIMPVAMYGTPEHSVCKSSLYWDKQTGKAYIIIHHLFQQSDDKDYQLWAIVDGKPVSIGIFRPGDKMKPLIMNNVPEKTSVFAVTLEKKGGSPTPSLDQMYLKGQMTL